LGIAVQKHAYLSIDGYVSTGTEDGKFIKNNTTTTRRQNATTGSMRRC
jgi:hypothetical protein